MKAVPSSTLPPVREIREQAGVSSYEDSLAAEEEKVELCSDKKTLELQLAKVNTDRTNSDILELFMLINSINNYLNSPKKLSKSALISSARSMIVFRT